MVIRQFGTNAPIMRTKLPISLALFLLAGRLCAQDIPNGGFENWTNQGAYSDPEGWLTSNMVSWSVAELLTCEQGAPGVEGAYFVKVTDRMLTGAGMQQASITVGTWGSFPAFPFTQRPDAFNGQWQYHPANGGHDGVVNATLTRWNTETGQREYIANAPIHAASPIDAWETFSSPFLYYSDATPDSAIVSIQATSASAGDGTSIWVDELSFGAILDVDDRQTLRTLGSWPSPATDRLHFRTDLPMEELHVLDATGRTMPAVVFEASSGTVDVSTLTPGIYLLRVRFNNGRSLTERFVKS